MIAKKGQAGRRAGGGVVVVYLAVTVRGLGGREPEGGGRASM